MWRAVINTLGTLLKCWWKSTLTLRALASPRLPSSPHSTLSCTCFQPGGPFSVLRIHNRAHPALFSSFGLKNKIGGGIFAGVYPCPILICLRGWLWVMGRAASLVTAPQAMGAGRGKQGSIFWFVCFSLNGEALGRAEGRIPDVMDRIWFCTFSLPSTGGAGLVAPAAFWGPASGRVRTRPIDCIRALFLVMLVGYNEKIIQIPSEKSFLPFIITGPDKLS